METFFIIYYLVLPCSLGTGKRTQARPSDPPVLTSHKCSVFKIPMTEDFNSLYTKV